MTRISRTEIVYAVGGALVTRWMVRPGLLSRFAMSERDDLRHESQASAASGAFTLVD